MKSIIALAGLTILLTGCKGSFADARLQMAPDGTYVKGTPHLAPDGTYVGGNPRMAPDGSYVGDGQTTTHD
jgi:hypothetical protein